MAAMDNDTGESYLKFVIEPQIPFHSAIQSDPEIALDVIRKLVSIGIESGYEGRVKLSADKIPRFLLQAGFLIEKAEANRTPYVKSKFGDEGARVLEKYSGDNGIDDYDRRILSVIITTEYPELGERVLEESQVRQYDALLRNLHGNTYLTERLIPELAHSIDPACTSQSQMCFPLPLPLNMVLTKSTKTIVAEKGTLYLSPEGINRWRNAIEKKIEFQPFTSLGHMLTPEEQADYQTRLRNQFPQPRQSFPF